MVSVFGNLYEEKNTAVISGEVSCVSNRLHITFLPTKWHLFLAKNFN